MPELARFFVLAIALTWALSGRLAWAFATGTEPPGWALALAGLAAFGPLIAAFVVSRDIGRLRIGGNLGWALAALFLPMAVNLVAVAIDTATGGTPDRWFHPPVAPEHVAALVFFSIGEEPGWRGYAHPRMVARFGPVVGALVLGLLWALWHGTMLFSPVDGSFDRLGAATLLFLLPLWSVIYGWLYVRTGGSLLVAIALHAGGHLDNVSRIPDARTRAIVGLVALILAIAAGRSLVHTSRT